MLRAGFEPAIPPNKRPQTYTLDRAASRLGSIKHQYNHFHFHVEYLTTVFSIRETISVVIRPLEISVGNVVRHYNFPHTFLILCSFPEGVLSNTGKSEARVKRKHFTQSNIKVNTSSFKNGEESGKKKVVQNCLLGYSAV
jgi:hypothetical protein